MRKEKGEEYWPLFDDGGSADGKGLPPWLVFLAFMAAMCMLRWAMS